MDVPITVIPLFGIIDRAKGSEFRQQVQQLVTSNTRAVLVDLGQVTFMDSAGLGSLVSAQNVMRNAGGQFYICGLNAQVKVLFEVTLMENIFKIYADQAAFKRAMSNL